MTQGFVSRNALNFSGGPGALPAPVLEDLGRAVVELPETGLSVLGMSHRSAWFREVVEEAEGLLRELLAIPSDYDVLFLQGGGTLQFAMVPLALLPRGGFAQYIESGYWSALALGEASRLGDARAAWSGRGDGYRELPERFEADPAARYLHYVSNETVEGLQFQDAPGGAETLRVCDMSSDLLSRPFDVSRYGLIYAHAQKNLGPAGVTLVIARKELIEAAPRGLPSMLDYRVHAEHGSVFNTPPVFAIYAVSRVLRWLRDTVGGVAAQEETNRRKASRLYRSLDAAPDFYRVHARKSRDRSRMNVAFRLPTTRLEALFLEAAEARGLSGLEGHRSLGGLRASLYNAVELEAVETLCGLLEDFAREHA